MKIRNYIWYEKYRPTSLANLSLPVKVKKQFKKYIKDKQIPHLLFHGPPGSGKTTIANILIKNIPCRSLVLNASSVDRGISTIKGKVKEFASSQALKDEIKIVFFDEADGLTPDAQMGLKNTIETYSGNCRFIFTANRLHKVIDAIRSRPIIFEFNQVDRKDLLKQMTHILEEEDVEFEVEDIEEIIDRFFPDVRTIVNNLQAASYSGSLDIENLSSFGIEPHEITQLITEGNLKEIRVKVNGLSDFSFIYRYLFDEYLPELDTESGIEFSSSIVKHLSQDTFVADRTLNFLGFCVDVMDILEVSEIKF